MKANPECIRCGVCCCTCTCEMGEERDDSDGCRFVEYDSAGKASCTRLVKGEVTFEDIGGGSGCILRHPDLAQVYKWYQEKSKPLKEMLMNV